MMEGNEWVINVVATCIEVWPSMLYDATKYIIIPSFHVQILIQHKLKDACSKWP